MTGQPHCQICPISQISVHTLLIKLYHSTFHASHKYIKHNKHKLLQILLAAPPHVGFTNFWFTTTLSPKQWSDEFFPNSCVV